MATATTLHDIVWARLAAITGIDAYDGEPPASPATDIDARVSPYAVLYTSAGNLYSESFDGEQRCLLANYQVTCIGGDQARAIECVDLVRAGLVGSVIVDGARRVIRAREEESAVRADTAVWPPRYYVPLEFQLFAP